MLSNKITLVTGASKGIGKAIALEFARNNATVIVNYNSDKNGAQQVVDEIKKMGKNGCGIKADVSKYNEVSSMIEQIKKDFGRIDVVVNNAGITMDRTLKNMTEEEWSKVISVNLTSVYNITKQALPLIPKNGRVVNISSIAGVAGNFGQCNYSASKAGIIGFTKSLSKELGKNGITVNAIAPGLIESNMTDKIPFFRRKIMTAMIPLKRMGTDKEVANCAVFLASDKSSYVTGEVLNVNGGIGL